MSCVCKSVFVHSSARTYKHTLSMVTPQPSEDGLWPFLGLG